ncbi:uncharacterized protein LOC131817924 isoform X3 [Mustela lutreola]|uniref:uncharacterized protein LOC131817924 isoform X3 n=2 Tax=Mustela lutreola TaxID=9666 RepID=UPI002797B79B|nr:uncharacterized protein LOC131817924 isoform X3 [Mustela lutreola]
MNRNRYLMRTKSRGGGEDRNGRFSGTAHLQGCGHRILQGGVGTPDPHPEATVQGRDVRELWTSPFLGSPPVKARPDHVFGAREAALGCEEKGVWRLPSSSIFT